jgi:hypothetical protein
VGRWNRIRSGNRRGEGREKRKTNPSTRLSERGGRGRKASELFRGEPSIVRRIIRKSGDGAAEPQRESNAQEAVRTLNNPMKESIRLRLRLREAAK